MGVNNQYIEEAKAKHKELSGGINNWGGRRDATDDMDTVLPESARMWYRQEYIVPRQHERDAIG